MTNRRKSSDIEQEPLDFAALSDGDEQAIAQIVEQSMERLKQRISRRLPPGLRRHTDEDDVAQSVMNSFICGVRDRERFKKLQDTNDLWQILGMLTKQKIAKHVRRNQAQKRGSGSLRGESIFYRPDQEGLAPGLDGIANQLAGVSEEIVHSEDFDQLLQTLDNDHLREIAVFKLDGFSHEEIAERMQMSVRSVGRKLDVIRDLWRHKIEASEG